MTTTEDTCDRCLDFIRSFLLTRRHEQLWTGTTDADPNLKNKQIHIIKAINNKIHSGSYISFNLLLP